MHRVELADRAGSDPRTEIALATAHADLAAEAGDHDKAIALARDVLEKVKARPGDTTAEQYELTFLLVEQLSYAGKMAEAAQASREAERLEAVLAQSSGLDVVTIIRRFNEAYMQGQIDRAIELAKQAVTLTETMPDPSLRIEATVTLARGYEFAHDAAKAIVAHQHVLDLCDKKCTP
ncbi:MAG TPA: hypothetical protein VFQ65_05905, partial [Kofleriaceae bacterium]|nr:hypothetical protein [Kofleriaceae bacterium]